MKKRGILLIVLASATGLWALWPGVDNDRALPGDGTAEAGHVSSAAVHSGAGPVAQERPGFASVSPFGAARTPSAPGLSGAPPLLADSLTNPSTDSGSEASSRRIGDSPVGGTVGRGTPGATLMGPSGPSDFEQRRADARRFVASLYRDFAGTDGDERAIALWADLIAAGTWTREQAVEHFLDSAPTLQGAAPLARLYFAFFQRVPDEAGWSHWRNAVASGKDLRSVSELFAASPELSATYGALSDGQFVDLVFRNTLGREATPAERTLWESQFAAGLTTRGQMMLAFAETPAFREAVSGEVNAALLYSGLLGRSADAPGLAAWMRTVESRGITRADMVAGFLDSAEYQARRPPRP